MQKKLKSGKLPAKILKKLICELPLLDPSVVIPPGIGFDAAGINIGDKLVAITTDPITLATGKIGTYSVAVNINDVACLGCKPRWYSAVLLLPIGVTQEQVYSIWNNLSAELKRYEICAIGGHTEVTSVVNSPVIIGQMIGEAIGDSLLDLRNTRAGDKILLWRSIAIEGTALLATEKESELLKRLSAEKIKKMQELLFEPGICIWSMVKNLLPCDGVVAIHDPTEGGIATALHELSDAASLGININADLIPILPETALLSEIFNFDPLGLLASGSALIVCRPDAVERVMKKMDDEVIVEIGEFKTSQGCTMQLHNDIKQIPRYDRDEISRLLSV